MKQATPIGRQPSSRRWRRGVALIAVMLLTSCGGGGSSPQSSVRLVHGAIDAPPLVVLSGEQLLHESVFGVPPSHATLPEGAESITVRFAHQASAPVVTFSLDPSSVRTHVLLATQRGAEEPSLQLLEPPPEQIAEGMSALRVLHALTASAPIEVTITGQERIQLVALPQQGSAYAMVPSGSARAVVRVAGRSIERLDLSLGSGIPYSLLVTGEEGYFVMSRLLLDQREGER